VKQAATKSVKTDTQQYAIGYKAGFNDGFDRGRAETVVQVAKGELKVSLVKEDVQMKTESGLDKVKEEKVEKDNYGSSVAKWKKAYQELLEVAEKYPNFGNMYSFYDIDKLREEAKKHLWAIELYEKYKVKLDHTRISSTDYINISDYLSLGYFGEKHQRTISWSDDGRQPENSELLLCIHFSTGAYIFGDDYPKEFFQEFYEELKSYKPKYQDTTNKYLYFSMDNASKIFNDFDTILQKYWDKNKADAKKRKIAKMKEQLAELEGGSNEGLR
jgi:hypothetical protein